MAEKLPHELALDRAKIELMRRKDSAFYTSLCFSMQHKFDDTAPTAYTDGKIIGYSPIWFPAQKYAVRVTVVVHEVLHVAYEHMGRLMGRDMYLWNVACDHVINLQLEARGFPGWDGWLCDHQYDGMSAEQVYNLLKQEDDAAGNPRPEPGSAGEGFMDLRPLPDGTDPAQFSQEVKEMLVRAAIRSKQEKDAPGAIPSDIEIMLRELLNPKLPWKIILRRFLQAFDKNDYSWRRPARRYFPAWILPSLYSERLMNITVAIDTSGSVSDDDFQVMVSEIAGVFKLTKPDQITLIQFDTEIKSVERIKGLRDLKKCKFTGRGGTDITEVLDWANLNKPQLLMFFTDGGFRAPEAQYAPSKTLWLIHDNPRFTSDYGKVIYYEMPKT